MNVGMKVTIPGKSIIARHKPNILSRPGQRTRAKLNPTMAEMKISPIIGIKVVIIVLTAKRPKGATLKASIKFCRRTGFGIHTGGL